MWRAKFKPDICGQDELLPRHGGKQAATPGRTRSPSASMLCNDKNPMAAEYALREDGSPANVEGVQSRIVKGGYRGFGAACEVLS